MKTVFSVLLWVPVVAIKVVLVVLGLIVVPVTSRTHGLYRAGPDRPKTYWERAVRNPVGGFDYLIDHPKGNTRTYGALVEPHLTTERFQYRFKVAGVLSSIRIVWKYSKTRYGESYVGWKIDSAPPRLDFAMSLRPWAKVGN